MTRANFFEMYNNAIAPVAKSIISSNISLNPDIKILFSDSPSSLYETYLVHKNALKMLLKKNDNARLDRHKVAACITVAILTTRPLSLEHTDEPDGAMFSPHSASRLNEQLAFFAGVYIVMTYMCLESDENKSVVEDIRNKLDTEGFVFPKTINSESYVDSTIRGLFYSGISYGLNPILLANIYYLLEEHFYCSHGIKFESSADPNKTNH